MINKCTFDNCNNDVLRQDLCSGHYQQAWKGKDLKPLRTFVKYDVCTFDGCVKSPYRSGLCYGHRGQVRKGKELTELRAKAKNGQFVECKFDSCKNKSHAGGYCNGHNKQFSNDRKLVPLVIRANRGQFVECKFDSCDKQSKANGYCVGHNMHHKAGVEIRELTERLPSGSNGGECIVLECDGVAESRLMCARCRQRSNKYKLSIEELGLLGTTCAICGDIKKRMCVDHDHDTGRVRGLLCHKCNTGIGMLEDSMELVFKAFKYLGGV